MRSGSLLPDIESRLAQWNGSCPTMNARHTCACGHFTLHLDQLPLLAAGKLWHSCKNLIKGMKKQWKEQPTCAPSEASDVLLELSLMSFKSSFFRSPKWWRPKTKAIASPCKYSMSSLRLHGGPFMTRVSKAGEGAIAPSQICRPHWHQ